MPLFAFCHLPIFPHLDSVLSSRGHLHIPTFTHHSPSPNFSNDPYPSLLSSPSRKVPLPFSDDPITSQMDLGFLTQQTDPFEVSPQAIFDYYGSTYYVGSFNHWSEQPATVSGMLHDQIWVNLPDLDFSRRVIDLYITEHSLPTHSCVDVGSGIGRVGIPILSDYFKVVDVVDPVEKFVAKAAEDLKDAGVSVTISVSGAQDWAPTKKYDMYWLQWTLSFLTDTDVVMFLKRCKENLNPNGAIFVKDNAIHSEDREKALFAPADRSLSRALRHYRELFIQAGLVIDFGQPQPNWPAHSFVPLYIFVLKPA